MCLMPCSPHPVPQASYGQDDEAAVQRVKEVYRQLDLEGLFRRVGWQHLPAASTHLLP